VPATPQTVWWIVVAGGLAVAVLVVAFGVAVVIYQRRYLAIHRRYTGRLLETQEAERAWTAREVHDNAIQHVALIRAECDVLLRTAAAGPGEVRERVVAVQHELEELGNTLRDLAHRLHPAVLTRAGLSEALQTLVDDSWRAYGLRVALDISPAPAELPRDAMVAVYRVAQEALRNAHNHGRVGTARLRFRETLAAWELTIEDDGPGFDVHHAEASHEGLGLLGMRERAQLIGGQVTIASRPGAGTRVQLTLPRKAA
jgi:two-component system sensor histidine kinase UhpB